MEKEQTVFQSFFRSELTWLGMILFAGWGVVTQIVIPLSVVQTQLAQIQSNLSDFKKSNQSILATDDQFNSRISVLEAEMVKIMK